jgi:hypothetical protein
MRCHQLEPSGAGWVVIGWDRSALHRGASMGLSPCGSLTETEFADDRAERRSGNCRYAWPKIAHRNVRATSRLATARGRTTRRGHSQPTITSTRVTARLRRAILPLDIGCDTAREPPRELPVSAAARHLPDQRSRVTETSDSEPLPTADQRNGATNPWSSSPRPSWAERSCWRFSSSSRAGRFLGRAFPGALLRDGPARREHAERSRRRGHQRLLPRQPPHPQERSRHRGDETLAARPLHRRQANPVPDLDHELAPLLSIDNDARTQHGAPATATVAASGDCTPGTWTSSNAPSTKSTTSSTDRRYRADHKAAASPADPPPTTATSNMSNESLLASTAQHFPLAETSTAAGRGDGCTCEASVGRMDDSAPHCLRK